MWCVFLKCCHSPEMCCANSVILIPGLSAAAAGDSDDFSEVWIWAVLVQLAGAQLTAWKSQLKNHSFAHTHLLWVFFFFCPIFLSSLLFVCGGVCLCRSWNKWLNYFKIWAWTVGLCCYLPTRTLSLSTFLTQQGLLSWCLFSVNSECFVWSLGLHFQLWEVQWGWVWEASLMLGLSSHCLGRPVTHRRSPQLLVAVTVSTMILPQNLWYHLFVPLFSGKILSKALLQVWSGGGSQAVFVEISSEFDWQQTKGKTKSFLLVLFTWNRVGRDTAKIQFLFSSTFLCVTELWLPGNQNITELSIFCSRKLSLSLLLNLDVAFKIMDGFSNSHSKKAWTMPL